jgi:hypothetical protein
MATPLWDVLAKAANLAQMSGLHAVMLVAVAAALLRIPQSKRECAELERCARRLQALLQWPATGSSGVELPCSGPLSAALGDAAALVDSYKKSTLWCRVLTGRSMAHQLRDMQDVLNSYCGLVLFLDAHLLLLQATAHPTPDTTMCVVRINSIYPSSTQPDQVSPSINSATHACRIHDHEVTDQSQSPGVQALTNCPTDGGARDTQKADDIAGQAEKAGNTGPAGSEGIVPAIAIFHA